jgi:hypothetical protein
MRLTSPTPSFKIDKLTNELPPFIHIVNLRYDWNETLLSYFYENCMKKYFPIEEELDPVEVWIENMKPENRNKESHLLLPDMHICIAFDNRLRERNNENIPKIVAATVFEYYKLSNCGLLSYFLVSEEYRESGMGNFMVNYSFQILKQISIEYCQKEYTEKLVKGIEKLEDESSREYFTKARELKQKPNSQLVPFFAETNAWGVDDGVMPAAKRHEIMRRIGFRMLDFDYIQPPLSLEKDPCPDLLLLVLDVPELPMSPLNSRKYVDSDVIRVFLLEFGYSVFENMHFIEENFFQHMMIDLAARGPQLYLSDKNDIPWTRRTNFSIVKAAQIINELPNLNIPTKLLSKL